MGNKTSNITSVMIDVRYTKLNNDAQAAGYHLNPDTTFTRDLIDGLLTNQQRYGYEACPCRLAAGGKTEDLDIICPCDYRDADLDEYGTCYCGLYVSEDVVTGKKKIGKIPERRPSEDERNTSQKEKRNGQRNDRTVPVWRCRVCGYLCARGKPPEVCPICKAARDRFEKFMQ